MAVLSAVVAVRVVAVPTARWRSTVTTICCRRSVHCRAGWSVAMNHDRSYQRHWFYSTDHSRGRRGIRYGFWCFPRIKKMLGRIETRTRDRIYCQTIRTVRDISRDDRARIATCSLRTQTDRLKENYSIDTMEGRQGRHIWHPCMHVDISRGPHNTHVSWSRFICKL